MLEQRKMVQVRVRNTSHESEEEVRQRLILIQLLYQVTPVDGCKSSGFFSLDRKAQMLEQFLFNNVNKQRTQLWAEI